MSGYQWTKEPWESFEASGVTAVQQAGVFTPPVISWQGFDDSDRTIEEHRANARRIVACVNALAGIPDPAAFMAEVREVLASAPVLFQCGIEYEEECATDDERNTALSTADEIRERIDALLAQMEGK